MPTKKTSKARATQNAPKRTYLSQTDMPVVSIEEALRVPQAIIENYACQSTSGLKVASALGLGPEKSRFKTLCSAAAAYGLITGNSQSEMQVESLAKRIIQPKKEGDDAAARREAFLKPRIINEFMNQYHNSPFPRDDIAENVLVDMGVPRDRTAEVLQMIVDGAMQLGFMTEIKGKKYIDLSVHLSAKLAQPATPAGSDATSKSDERISEPPSDVEDTKRHETPMIDDARKKRVFIAHGKNKALIEPIKKLLKFGELEAVVAVERQSVSQPIPDKVMEDLRSCGAAIIHIEGEQKVLDQQATEHVILNPNVMIEIGASLALYGRRLILLVNDGVTVPSNLTGLLEVRYSGDTLDGEATIRLLEAINDIKNHPLPV